MGSAPKRQAFGQAHKLATISGWPCARGGGQCARVQVTILALIVLLAGVVLGVVWLYRAAQPGPAASPEPAASQTPVLSETTLAVLRKLDAPVEIRFYSVLDPAMASDALSAFAGRVGQLLSAYQQAAGGKLKLTRIGAQANLNPNTVAADGIQVFNLDRGEASYLGVALALKGRRESLPRLVPDWEPALEADLTRALVRLQDATRPVPVTAPAVLSQISTAAVQEIRALIPDLAAVSLEEGTRILRESALKEFTATAQEMETQVKEAEQLLARAQNAGVETDQQAAMKHLQELQARQTDKLKQIAARSKAQIDTLRHYHEYTR